MTESAVQLPTIAGTELEHLLTLLDTPAPSGFEHAASAVWRAYADDAGLTTSVDALGSSFATANPDAAVHVALVGHLDEIGLLISRIDDKGFLRCVNIGGWDIAVLVGQRVRITTAAGDIVRGTVCRPAVHALDAEARARVPKLTDLWIDIGAESGDEARARVAVGDSMVIDVEPWRLGDHRIVSRSADNRVGAFIALQVAIRSIGKPVKVTAVGSVGEEIGGHGAQTSVASLMPDRAIALDVTTPGDTPSAGDIADLSLGKGPVITRGATTNLVVSSALIAAATANDLPHQLRGLGVRTATDADQIVRAGTGVATGLMNVPARYLHSPCEQFDLRDVAATIEILCAYIDELGATLA